MSDSLRSSYPCSQGQTIHLTAQLKPQTHPDGTKHCNVVLLGHPKQRSLWEDVLAGPIWEAPTSLSLHALLTPNFLGSR